MADDDELEDDEDVGDEEYDDDEEGGGPSKKGGKKKLLILIGVALLLVVGGAAAAYFTGLLDPVIEMLAGGEAQSEQSASGEGGVAGSAVFHDLPEMLVNLNTGGRKSTFLKIRVSLELEKPEDIPKIESVMTRVIDNFQVYLRELRVEDLKGSAGMYRLREELLMRVSAAAAPAKVKDVLFKEMLVQ